MYESVAERCTTLQNTRLRYHRTLFSRKTHAHNDGPSSISNYLIYCTNEEKCTRKCWSYLYASACRYQSRRSAMCPMVISGRSARTKTGRLISRQWVTARCQANWRWYQVLHCPSRLVGRNHVHSHATHNSSSLICLATTSLLFQCFWAQRALINRDRVCRARAPPTVRWANQCHEAS